MRARGGDVAVEVWCCRSVVLVRDWHVECWRCRWCGRPAHLLGRHWTLAAGGPLPDDYEPVIADATVAELALAHELGARRSYCQPITRKGTSI